MRILALALFAVAACVPEEHLEPWVDPGTSDQFLGYDEFPEVELLLDDGAIASLRAAPREYVRGTLVYRGQSFGPVGVRLKGQNSFQPIDDKPSFRINVDEYIDGVTFYGLQDLTFNNMASDASMLHERLAYRVAREAGIPASRANHMLLSVNGAPQRLYMNVETVKPRMLRGWFDDEDGPLFEATDVDFAAPYIDAYQLKSGPDDRSALHGVADALAGPAPMSDLSPYLDIDTFQRFWAFESVVGQFDAFPFSFPGDDYFVYADPDSGRLAFLPWGMDETFFAADFSPLATQSVLAAACKANQACFDGYVAATWDILEMTEDMDLEAERLRVIDQIAPYVPDDPQVAEMQTQVGYFIRDRRIWLGMYLPP